jgi:hypothetical protein
MGAGLATQLWELLVGSAADAFVEVGVFVGAVLLAFQYVNYVQQGRLVDRIANAAGWQPALGALLGLTPGCGGAIFVMTLYVRGSVTFGTVVATLVATMGDAAFVLAAAAPLHFLYVSAASLVAAVAVGYAVDALRIGAGLRGRRGAAGGGGGVAAAPGRLAASADEAEHLRVAHGQGADHVHGGDLVHDSDQLEHIGHAEGDAIDLALHHRHGPTEGSLGYRLTHRGFIAYWGLLAVGLVFGLAGVLGHDLGERAGWPELTVGLGVLGTAAGIALTAAARRFGVNTSHEDEEHKLFSLRETLIHGAMDTAFVTTWVFVSFVLYHLGVLWLGGGDLTTGETLMASWMQRTGLMTVVVGALLGLIPGCGPQILFVTMFTRGLVPFAALLANAISQDGDALFPLLALDRRSALAATLITTVPAVLFGLLVYWLESTTGLGALLRP